MQTFSYADYIILSCSSLQGFNKMSTICSEFETNNCITFKAKKTIICIKYGVKVIFSIVVLLFTVEVIVNVLILYAILTR